MPDSADTTNHGGFAGGQSLLKGSHNSRGPWVEVAGVRSASHPIFRETAPLMSKGLDRRFGVAHEHIRNLPKIHAYFKVANSVVVVVTL